MTRLPLNERADLLRRCLELEKRLYEAQQQRDDARCLARLYRKKLWRERAPKGTAMLDPIYTWQSHLPATNVDHREYLGRIVRDVWVAWASEQPNPKPHHLDPWEVLPPEIQEVDRRIGETIERVVLAEARALLRQCRPWLPAVERELRDAVRRALGEEV